MHCCGATILLFIGSILPMLEFVLRRPKEAAETDERIRIMLTSIVRFLREWRLYNRSVGELSRLGDRELADIGISRSDIARVAWTHAHRR